MTGVRGDSGAMSKKTQYTLVRADGSVKTVTSLDTPKVRKYYADLGYTVGAKPAKKATAKKTATKETTSAEGAETQET